MLGLLEVLGAVLVIVFAGLVLWGLYWLLVNLLNDFVNRRLIELYKQKNNLWLGVNDAYDNYEDLKEKVWDYEETKFKLKVAMKDIEALEEYILNQDNLETKISDLWVQRDTIYYFIDKLEERINILEKDKLLK